MAGSAVTFAPGGYRYLPAVMQYSAGVAAASGFAIERVQFLRPLPLDLGFEAAAALLHARNRELTAFCACELRSPAPFTEQGFAAFNRQYVTTLERWGVYRNGVNPVARTNVCPVIDPPSTPSMHAFAFTVPADPGASGTFVVAGSGETREGGASYRESIVAYGDVSTEGLRQKMRHVVAEMQRRLSGLGFAAGDATAVNAYTAHDVGALLRTEIFERGFARDGLMLQLSLPPVVGLEFEMDVRRTAAERFVAG
jgi:hypothetical protein